MKYILFCLISLLAAPNAWAQDENSLLNALEKEKDKAKRSDWLYQLGLLYQKKESYKKAINYFEQALPASSNKDAPTIKQHIVRAYASLQDYKNAITKGDELLGSYADNIDTKKQIILLNELSDYAQQSNNYDKALYYNERLLGLYQSLNELKGQAVAYNNLGVAHRRMGDKAKSTDYFNKAIQTNKEVLKGKSLSIENNAFTHINVGVTYLQLKNYKQANDYFDQGLSIAADNPKVKASALNYTAMGRYLNDQNNEALDLAIQARDLAETHKDNENLLAAYKILSLIYQSQDDFKEAQEYNNQYQALAKNVDAKRQQDIQRNLQKEIDIEKKEGEIKSTIAENNKREATLKQSELERQKSEQELKNREQELRIAKQNQEIAEAKLREQSAAQQRTQQLLEIVQQKAENERQKGETEKQKSEAERQKLLADKERTEKESREKDLKGAKKDIKFANEQKKLQDAKLRQEQMVRYLGIGILMLVIGLLVFVYLSLRKTRTLNNKINTQVVLLQEQQEEISVQNEELMQSQEEVMSQRDALEETNKELKDKNSQIVASITYAQRIQAAMLPTMEKINSELPECFVLFRPRDIVSGDFFYFDTKDEKTIIAAVDCTGHGVPGAFMSMMGNEILSKIVTEKRIFSPDKILYAMNEGIQTTLKQDQTQNRDGMDMAILVIDKTLQKVEYAGAKNPLYYFQNNELMQIKASKNTIGGVQPTSGVKFEKHTIDISNTSTTFYIFSDGYQDQFGGEDDKKFTVGKFRNLLQEIHQQPMPVQEEILSATMNEWLGHQYKQIDDIVVIGVRL